MLVTTGRVNGGAIECETGALPDGATVTILMTEDGETFDLDANDQARILAAIAEAEHGDLISADKLLNQIRKS